MIRIKICGITNCNDAKIAYEAGADAIGLVFYPPSPRFVTAQQAHEVVDSLAPFVTSVGLFVDASKAEVENILAQVALDLLQFHGNESAEFCASFQRPYIKAIRMKEDLDLLAVQNEFSSARGILLDTYKKGIPGGTGETFNWHRVPHDPQLPIILAGGLDADNIMEAIHQAKPYAVDVSGGVEATKGIKDPGKVKQFVANALQA
ncbi:phosphoribosylanthranilate isomerase [sulfur-oxidizing endosymbiont of Gigantopelta aegis]|uniref:phosphoribosylanthranilate isomerase n=1 Tax=sulfur-oxidizing endosymbiont of Gigantopelta aegis TaxID=2794934 RepID=UPI0018DC5FA2|nr:phosphoribosylanthranilate isomerase [sulfur-oxidizing endosymbiont of Gigantopelta aegis]